MYTEILNLLRDKEYCLPASEITKTLGLTSQEFHTHIHKLRDLGYKIAAVPHQGYKLTAIPDNLYPWEVKHNLKTQFMGIDVIYHDETDSTMDIAHELATDGAPEGIVVCAEHQRKGRGRWKREWASPHKKGLYLSLILRPKKGTSSLPLMGILAAVTVVRAIKNYAKIESSIKWPNDILIKDKKVAGILTEAHFNSQHQCSHVIAGIGINVNTGKDEIPPEATSLYCELKNHIGRIELFRTLLEIFEELYRGFNVSGSSGIIEEYKKSSFIWGRRIKVILPDSEIEATPVDIDQDGYLILREDSGTLRKITSGEVVKII